MAARPAAAAKSNTPKRRKMAAPAAAKNTKKPRCSCLPDELWEKIFKSLNCNHQFLSVVSKQFLSITNRLRSSLTITDETIPYLPRLFHRYPNLTSVDLTRLSQARDLGAILTQISTFSIDLRSLSCNSFAANGFLALSKTMKNLTSFSFTPLFPSTRRMGNIKKNDFLFILHCFPLLDNLNLSFYPDEPSDQILKFELFRSRIDGRFSWKYEVL
ncbi:uncharacterized protein LOC131650708 [Vicia villosa]|uniref:uncharacterized protein LOC131650708 n=1 Tax=Vicia villosa TaxID=3911 RepID=UPI00273C5389|nr:uncharacterized protein LOC131650708 [Vicia villosa]